MRLVLVAALAVALAGVAAVAPVASADGVCETSHTVCYAVQNTKCTLQHDDPYRVLIDCWNFIGP